MPTKHVPLLLHPGFTVGVMYSDAPYHWMTFLACAWLAVNLIRGLWPKK